MTAFHLRESRRWGIHDVTDLGSYAPNADIQKQPSSNSNMSIYIRGVGSGRHRCW
ncbi:MAG: hypothetical protein U5K56_13125 [Halioglobus sp.]|nr:hypothetical protein [Halioglobus sp.]